MTSTDPRDEAVDPREGLGSAIVWLPPAVELEAYEGIRGGDEDAFRLVAEPLQPVLRRLVCLTTDSPDVVNGPIADSWGRSLRTLGMFTWHTSFTSWVAAGVVRTARSRARESLSHVAATGTVRHAGSPRPGPADWSDLPWAARWDRAPEVTGQVLEGLPLASREALHVHQVERWPAQRACEVLGLTVAQYRHLLDDGHRQIHDALACLVCEQDLGERWSRARIDPVGVVLRLHHGPIEGGTAPLDPQTLAAFREWAAHRPPPWRRWAPRLFPRRTQATL